MPMVQNKKINVPYQTKAMKVCVTKNDFPNYIIIIKLYYIINYIKLYKLYYIIIIKLCINL